MGGWCRSPPLLINNTRDGKKSKTSILNTPSRGRKNMETFRVNSEKKCGNQIITLGVDLIQVYSKCTQDPSMRQAGFN